eukprot:symbB.v1.2.031973.t1/scaffold3719.1/size53090/1
MPHPCLVQLFSVHNFRDAGLYLLVMEFCPGGTLTQRIQRARSLYGRGRYQAPALAVAWIAQVFLGLEHMHRRMDTLLRDLKPDNVVLSASGVAKLTDFGFGRFGVEASSGTWSFGVPAGSPGYVAPEVILQRNYDYSADLYSLGVLTWVLLSGGLMNVEPPGPPTGRRRLANDFRVHAKDFRLLQKCLEDPPSNGAIGLGPQEQDFVARLTAERPERRLSHGAIRQHQLFRGLTIPAMDAPATRVKSEPRYDKDNVEPLPRFFDASHRQLMEDAARHQGLKPNEVDVVPVLVPQGGAGCHNGCLWHGSGPNQSKRCRRGLGIHFVPQEVQIWTRPDYCCPQSERELLNVDNDSQ